MTSIKPLSAGTNFRAVDFPRAQFAYDQSTIANWNTATYTVNVAATNPEVAVRCLAPTSGKIGVCISGGPRNNSTVVDRFFLAFRVLEGDPADGTLIQTDDAKWGISNTATSDASDDYSYGGHFTVVGGLTPGVYYYFQSRFRDTVAPVTGTADCAFRTLMAIPLP